jgi:hypothetical protein
MYNYEKVHAFNPCPTADHSHRCISYSNIKPPMKTTMEQPNQFHTTAGAAGGSLLTIVVHLIQMDWSSWAVQAAQEIIKVIVVGILGGAAGVLGTHLMKKYLLKK